MSNEPNTNHTEQDQAAAGEAVAEVRAQIAEIEAKRREIEERSAALYEDLLKLDPEAQIEGGDADPEAELRVQIAETELKYKRALADFQNFRKRSIENEAEARRQGMVRVVESLLGVLDNFGLALNVDPTSSSAESVLQGVRFIHDDLVRSLGAVGLERIEPAKGEAFDADRHQAVMQEASDEVGPGCVVSMQAPGYAIGERIVRPARVVVRPTEGDGEAKPSGGSCGSSCGCHDTEQQGGDDDANV